ncbi:MAG: MCP four helix bundle domain-containing protein [Saprospiraceae bacterium]|nr:MCP four helix bundle domain-containing protein [Saprospiraceae bacterium]MBK9629683.1 MCP four helix bundle domain-containing protein [Saprospiraceae bacterium]
MKWTYNIKNKLLASIVLLALCLLVLLSHYLDRIHTQNVKNSIVTLYEDRLIAEDYILKMTINIYQIREVLNTNIIDDSKSATIGKLVDEFNTWNKAYMKTKLTSSEKTRATELIGHVKIFEQKITNTSDELSKDTENALISLNKLSNVQLEESKLIMQNAESEYANIKASSQFAFAIIIIILFVLQAIVFSAKTILPINKPQNPNFN